MLRRLLVLTLFAAVTLLSAQQKDLDDLKLTVDVDLVHVPVSVVDKHGFPVNGLRREHFIVYEDKVLQNLSLFTHEDIPLSVSLVLDASGSILQMQDKLNAAAMTFIRESNPQDETSIVSFGEEVFLEQPLTSNREKLSSALAGITLTDSTAFYDAVFLAIKHLENDASMEKKVIIVISDGEDNRSRQDFPSVLKELRKSKVALYSIGLVNSAQYLGAQNGKKFLKQLAEVSGGASFFPKDISEVEAICKRIAHDLRNQYTIGYRPSNTKMDGSWRKIDIKLKPPPNTPKVSVRSKQGYYARVMQ